MDDSRYADWTIPQLKSALRSKGAKVSGRKRELVERLEAYDRNAGHFHESTVEEAWHMQIPDNLVFKDINTESPIPIVKVEDVATYLSLYNQDLRQNAVDMYKGKFLQSIRYAHCDDSDGASYEYIKGRVAAEMFKSVIYNVDLKLDKHGIVQLSQCDCGVGMGPEAHCKHVALVYYALAHAQEGIITRATCTQVLQTFHQAKKYTGSPVKMSQLILRDSESLKSLQSFDPRPIEYRNRAEYPSTFRNIWLNSSAQNIPIRQLYSPANMYAVATDHDYMATHPEETFLQSLGLSSLSEVRCREIQQSTVRQSKCKIWKTERCLRIHSSNFDRICKRTSKTNSARLARSLMEIKDINTEPIKHGRKYEKVALKAYMDMSGKVVVDSGIVIKSTVPYLGCSPDGLVGDNGIVEVKCPYSSRNAEISPVTVPYLCSDNDAYPFEETTPITTR